MANKRGSRPDTITVQGVTLHSAASIAKMLGVSERSVIRYHTIGKLRATLIGGKRYTSEEALNEYLKGETK